MEHLLAGPDSFQAPVLLLPSILEPKICEELIAGHRKDGGEFGISISNISAPGATMSFTVNGRANTVIASSDLNGTVSPKGTLATNGSSKSFTFTPNAGYEIDAIKVNGATVATANPYVLANTSGNQTINVTFKKKATIDPLPNPWSKLDIGSQPAASSFDVPSSGKFYIESASSAIQAKSDNFNYIFQTLNGDGSIVVRLASSNMPSYEGKFGIMVRESLQSSSAFSLIANVPHSGVATQQRTSDG